jgi:hypothetical protein
VSGCWSAGSPLAPLTHCTRLAARSLVGSVDIIKRGFAANWDRRRGMGFRPEYETRLLPEPLAGTETYRLRSIT